jgi:hypothetical protein
MSHSHTHSPLQTALAWWAGRDEMGGFATAAAALFPGWVPKASCRAPHREDRSPSFSLYYRNGAWRFKDHATGEGGGLVDFVMLAGMDAGAACRWVMEGSGHDEAGRGPGMVGAVVPNRPRRAQGPRINTGLESQTCFHGCGRLRSTAPTGCSDLQRDFEKLTPITKFFHATASGTSNSSTRHAAI